MEQYLMYLRKSRADRDAVDEPVQQTLQRHKARLDEYCRQHRIFIPDENILFEVSSADSIASRPMMIELLHRVETGAFTAVLCIDMDRLSRGSGADQALVINTFKYSNTQIITPSKTYDFSNESDEQFAELGLFMAKSEYRQIKKRLRQGKIDAVKEGKSPAANPPYGYVTYKLPKQKGFSLQVVPEQADVVKLIFDKYVHGNIGSYVIAQWLNKHGYRDQFGNQWTAFHVTKILADPTYTGKVRYAHRVNTREMQNGQLVKVNKRNYDELVCAGIHEAIIPDSIFAAAQEIRQKRKVPCARASAPTQNPLCGLVECAVCGKKLMLRSPDKYQRALYCPTPGCPTRGAYVNYVEEALLMALEDWLAGYTIKSDNTALKARYVALVDNLNKLQAEIEAERKRQKKIYDLLERDVYTLKEFQLRISESKNRIAELEQAVENIKPDLEAAENPDAIVPAVRTVIDKYRALKTPAEKNAMLKLILEKVIYQKTTSGRTHGREFTLTMFPKIPKI